MKRVCVRCERLTVDGNLWCQERDCPAGATSVVLGYGDSLGDVEVVRLISVLNSAAVYEARRGDTPLLLKVAHEGCQEQLKREAAVLAANQHPMLPVLLPPYPQVSIQQRPYGKTVFRDDVKYYEVFAFVDGESLRDKLAKNPQPWYLHAAWIIISIADALAFLHVKAGKLHLNLNPDAIFVRLDRDGIPRPLLLDLGVVGDLQTVDLPWLQQHGLPAYTPPEMLAPGGRATFASDVYGLGLVMYELLAGQPAFAFEQYKSDEVRNHVLYSTPKPLNRSDLSNDVIEIVHQAIARDPAQRQPEVRVFAKLLRSKFGEVPAERKDDGTRRKVIAAVIAVGLVMLVFVLLAIFLS
jgi:serine/threonine-protein kinase